MYIKVWDKKGIEEGYGTGTFRTAEHRVLIEKGNVYGAENFIRNLSVQERQMVFNLINMLPKGEYGDLSWERE